MSFEESSSLSPEVFSPLPQSPNDSPNELMYLPNDHKYYQNNLDKNQFNLVLINSCINLIKLLYLKHDDVQINQSNLRYFIIEVLKRSKASIQNLQVLGFYLLKLIKNHDSNLTKDYKKLFLGLLILASKFNQDCNYCFKTWLKIVGLKNDQENISNLKSLEINILSQLDYNCYINSSFYENWCNVLLIFGYDFIKLQEIYHSKSVLIWESDKDIIFNKLTKWNNFFKNVNLSSFDSINIKFHLYYLNQFNQKVVVSSLFNYNISGIKRELETDFEDSTTCNDDIRMKVSCR